MITQGLMNLSGRPVAAFDPEGLIFAAGVNSEHVKLYDLRLVLLFEGLFFMQTPCGRSAHSFSFYPRF